MRKRRGSHSLLREMSKTLEERWRRVSARHSKLVRENKIVGSSLIFLYENHLLENHVGYGDLESRSKTNLQTIYYWASITKTLTGIAVLRLCDQNKIRLTDPVVRYIPELQKVHSPFCKVKEIQIRHLLTHSVALRPSTWLWKTYQPWYPAPAWEQFSAMMPFMELLSKPGASFSYSNLCAILLGRIIEFVSGSDYQGYVGKHLLSPMNMRHSYFGLTPRHLLKYRSNNYFVTDGKRIINGFDYDPGIGAAYGGLNASCEDMAHYMNFLIGDQINTDANDDILKRTTLEKMWRPVLPIQDASRFRESIGLAFFLVHHGGNLYVGHTGGQLGFLSFLYVNPIARKGCVLVFNTTGIAGKNRRISPNTLRLLNQLRHDVFVGLFAEAPEALKGSWKDDRRKNG